MVKSWGLAISLGLGLVSGWALVESSAGPDADQLWRLRNLGKAFYENPTTQAQAVEQFRLAWKLDESSVVDRLNYGLALIRAGKGGEGMAELEAVQKLNPKIPHTWFNLGIEFKKLGETDKAIAQLEQMARLVPDEPITHYNLGVIYKSAGRTPEANAKFELAARLDPNFAAPHFQLFNFYRQSGQAESAKRELETFQDLKRRHEESGGGNEDVEWSLYSEILEPGQPPRAPAPPVPAALRFTSTALAGKTAGETSLVVLDADGDGAPDLLVVSAAGVRLYRNGITPVAQPALEAVKDAFSAVAGDFDNDGLPDLCVLTAGGARVFRNTKSGFVPAELPLPAARFDVAVWIDYDHDYDLDLLLLGEKNLLLRNQAEGGWGDRTADLPLRAGKALAATLFRLIPDSKSHDLLVSYAGRPGMLYHDRLGGKFDAQELAAVPAGAAPLAAVDLDNDGAADIVWPGGVAWNRNGRFEAGSMALEKAFAFADFENRGVLDAVSAVVLRNEGGTKFRPAEAAGLPAGRTAIAAADFDSDGRVDLVVAGAGGAVHRALNQTALKSGWSRVKLNGVKNLKLAPGAEVEVKAGVLYQKLVYAGTPLHFGLRDRRQIDTIRITWPNGLIQNETNQKSGVGLSFQEAQRLSGSCPVIWTWNGSRFEYITDVLGVAPLGASAGDGTYFPVDHDEYVSIAADLLRADGGRLKVRITEELAEVSYLDQVELVAVDHPAGVEVFSNDKWKSPPFPEFRLFGAAKRVYAVSATENGRTGVLDRLLRRDGRYADSFSRDMRGAAAAHTLELDFGNAASSNRAVLVLNGWVDWADGSTFLERAQARPGGLTPPRIEVKDAQGRWVTAIPDMGMPAGKPKTIAVDLTGKFPTANREVRIVTDLCLYWDEVFLSEDSSAPPARLTRLAPASADLRFRGFSRNVVHPARLQPEQFFYENPAAVSMWNPTPGLYTRYGDVAGLLREVDDRLTIVGSGDEVALEFDAARLPTLPAGWRRDWLLKVDGWAKDRDANTAYSQNVEPLPFHGMSGYPYPASEHFPESQELKKYREEYNTRPALRLLRALNETGTRSITGNR